MFNVIFSFIVYHCFIVDAEESLSYIKLFILELIKTNILLLEFKVAIAWTWNGTCTASRRKHNDSTSC